MIIVRIDDKTFVVNDDGILSQHHLPKYWFNKNTAERVAAGYINATVTKWEGR
jgi:hypothetical protein